MNAILRNCLCTVMIPAGLLAQSESPKKKPEAHYKGDPGKYVEEPTKNMAPGSRTARPGSVEAINAAGLARMLPELPEGTRHEHFMMPLRDGVKLATDVFLPPSGKGPWPAVLLRTQYSRWDARGLRAMKGEPCALVVQNVRGAYGSEGAGTFDSHSFDMDINDSYDTVEWVAAQEWSNGKVGMWGPSGHGIAACNALWSQPPHLTVVDVNVTGDNAHLHWTFNNGARRFLYSWLSQRGLKTSREEWPRPTVRPYDDEAYYDFIKERAAHVTATYRMKAGWFDVFSEAALDHFMVLAPTGKASVQISPTGHGAIGGDLVFKARNPYPREAYASSRGLKECLAGESVPDSKSLLTYYLMGDTKDPESHGNITLTTDHWPIEHTPTAYYLREGLGLNLESPAEKDASLSYEYDPRNPVPSLGGNYDVSDPKRLQIGPLDQRPNADREDILRFKTDPLAEPVGVIGKIRAELHISSDAPDTMFTAKLVDIYPDGYEAVIRESAMLARYHGGLNRPAPIEKGAVYTLEMDLWSTAIVFNTGHRIGFYVTSSSDPAYEVHPNTYEPVGSLEECRVARNTIHLSSSHPSKLILPVVAKTVYER